MTVASIVSAIGNNSTPYPLLIRDCFIEVPSKIYVTRKENLKESRVKANDATRENTIDEYVTSAVWLGGIPLTEGIGNKFIRYKKYNPDVNIKLFNEDEFQGINLNIEKFKKLAPEAVEDLIKVKNNKKAYQKLVAGKFAAAIVIPTAIMGFVLPKLNFALTKKIKDNRKANNSSMQLTPKTNMASFMSSNKDISFGGGIVPYLANLNTVNKMAITDGGLTVGRVTPSRNKEEAAVNGFRMLGSMFLNFVAPLYIAKFLDKFVNKVFGVNVDLDPLILDKEELIDAIRNNKIELPKSDSAKDIFEFLDTKQDSLFVKYAKESKKVSYLENGVRDPRKYVNVKDVGNFRNEFARFVEQAKNSKNIEAFVKKAKYIKYANILSNIGICSALLAFVLPLLQYQFNKLVTGSYSDPGLRD